MMYVGVDVHKKVCRAAIVDDDDEVVDEFSFRNSAAEIAAVAVNDERVKLLMTMPGLGCFAASLLVAEICDIHRFSSDKRLVSWTGLAPSIRQSGDKARAGGITKQGNKPARWVMV